ncbi:MAG: NAD-dependent deacetylase, partial [Winogradskyella sp.]|uniref:SIR2 family NAD-dependent protein deacylase n=1 Tax=Winogradskyella sp. TaxID=1883156 RepID=UPI00385F355F
RNPELVLNFYNERRRQLKDVAPNSAHQVLATLENDYKVTIITQNVDDLHERAGSTDVVHLHGELLKIRSTGDANTVKVWKDDIHLGDLCDDGYQLRPHIVWFGEDVPEIETAIKICYAADILVIIGTSMQVYPAASLIDYVQPDTSMYYIDPKPAISGNNRLTVIAKSATEGMVDLLNHLE